MYKIKRTEYGIHVTMGGLYEEDEIEKYVVEKEKMLSSINGPYSIIVDLRTAIPPKYEDAELLKESQTKMKSTKLNRMAIIVSSPVIMGQAKQIGFLAGIGANTKYIDASQFDDSEKLALQWILEGVSTNS